MLCISRSSAVGSALRSGRRGRAFESPLLDKKDSLTAVLFVWRLSALGVLRHYRSVDYCRGGNFQVASSRQKDGFRTILFVFLCFMGMTINYLPRAALRA